MEYRKILTKKLLPNRLQFYSSPPTDTVSLDTVENLAIERLKILRCIDTLSEDYIKGKEEYNDQMCSRLTKLSKLGKYFVSRGDIDISKSANEDILSHYILRMAYCFTDELSKWFIAQECDLFQYRFNLEMLLNPKSIRKFMSDNGIFVEEATSIELKKFFQIDNAILYKVPFIQVNDLVRSQRVNVHKGFAFLSDSEMCSLALWHYRSHLSRELSYLRLNIHNIDEDNRLMPILSTLSKRYTGKNYSTANSVNTDKITAEQIDGLSVKSFPPCMQHVHSALKRDSHVRHSGRMQCGLFLKGIGVPLEESLKFWREGFKEKCDSNTFAKKYAYNIRHNYGQEGKRLDYTPYSCVRIISSTPAHTGDCHGCPFQQTDLELMAQNLRKFTNATSEQIESIISKAKMKQFQISCRNYFKMVHGLPGNYPVSINHPNEYFEESQKILNK